MVRIYVSDVRGINLSRAEEGLPPEVREHISGRDGDHRSERVCAYLLLSAGYRESFGEPLPRIFWDEKGKPYLSAGGNTLPPAISISHSGGIVSCAMDLSGDISALGVDIEEHRELACRERIERRLLSHTFDARKKEVPIEILRARVEHGASGGVLSFDRLTVEPIGHDCPEDGRFFDKWTALEALLKADGGGFAAISRTGELAERALLSTVRLSLGGKELSLSAAALG